jgi:hypothetical protein
VYDDIDRRLKYGSFKIQYPFFMIYREGGGSKALWNTSKYMPVYRISHPRQEPSPIPM